MIIDNLNPELARTPEAPRQREEVIDRSCYVLHRVMFANFDMESALRQSEANTSAYLQSREAQPPVANEPATQAHELAPLASIAVESTANSTEDARIKVEEALRGIGYGN